MNVRNTILIGALFLGATGFALQAEESPIEIHVNATDAPRNILRAKLRVPAEAGPLTLVYPKWIPGEHGPTGPIIDLTGLKITSGGHAVEWARDAEDMYAFHVTVPAGENAVDVSLDFLLPNSGAFSSGGSSTAKLLDLNWNQVLLYPMGRKASEVQFTPSLTLPKGWKYGTPLKTAGHKMGGSVDFATVSLETLVDSPVIAGEYFKSIDLSPKVDPAHRLNIVADSEAALEITPETSRDFSHLITETGALFGARHYRSYDFLLTLSDHVAHFGLEHHESSDNREPEDYLIDKDALRRGAYLLCHEMVHSWNGKYRRPLGLATEDYQHPMKGELLWVYEGLTDYLGIVLATRCGLWTNQNFREYVALEAALLDQSAGRTWRSLADTTVSAQLLYEARSEGASWRRSTDFYSEGDLIWLEVDVLIRQLTHNQKSIEDFCRKFHGGPSGPPKVVTYTRDDIVAALNEIAPYDWNGFFQKRVYAETPRAPLGGIENSGWRLTYTNEVPAFQKSRESSRKYTDMRMSLGLLIKEEGDITDVLPGSPADKIGLGVGMKLIAVNARGWTPEILRNAVKMAATDHKPIELLLENEDYYKTYKLNYRGGEKYPQLERDPAKADLLSDILKPLTSAPAP